MSNNPNPTFHLLKQRRFSPLFFLQFLGAFNDNVFKNALMILITYTAFSLWGMSSALLVNFGAGVFVLPFFLFSAFAGELADKYEKSRLIKYIKFFEIIIVSLAALCFIYHQTGFLLALLFLLGLQSTLFGPVKYSILPQYLDNHELLAGNGLIEMGTFVAILTGTILGGLFLGASATKIISVIIIGVAVAGWLLAFLLPKAESAAPNLKLHFNPLTETIKTINFARKNRRVFLAIIGISWLWFIGIFYLSQFPQFGKNVIGGNAHVVTLLIACFSIGIGLGSVLCDKLSDHRLELGLVPFGALGFTIFSIDLFFAGHHTHHFTHLIGVMTFLQYFNHWHILLDITLIGLFGGFFSVPLYTMMQQETSTDVRARVVAANNILNALFMVMAALVAMVLLDMHLSIVDLFLVVGLLNAIVTLYIFRLAPIFLIRFMIWFVMNLFYRIRVSGKNNIPHDSAALLICNHVSFIDVCILSAKIRRPIRYIIDKAVSETPGFKKVFEIAETIRIESRKKDPELFENAFHEIRTALENGELVCIFPEGQITRTGKLGRFLPGVMKIIDETPVPVIPMALKGLWGSFYSRQKGKAMAHFRFSFQRKVELKIAEPIAAKDVSMQEVRDIVVGMLE